MSEQSKSWLMKMIGVEEWKNVPADLLSRIDRMNAFIDKAKLGCGIESSQILALLVMQWEDGKGNEG